MSTHDPLPSGRRAPDAMSSAQVAEHQRTRMLLAMAEAVAEVGYSSVTVADVIKRASVSRATFYEQFADKRGCFLAAYEVGLTIMMADDLFDSADSLPQLITRYLDTLGDNPEFARVFTVEVNSLGVEGMRIRRATQARFADAVASLVSAGPELRFACDAYVAALAMMVSLRLATDDVEAVRALREPLLDLAVRMFG